MFRHELVRKIVEHYADSAGLDGPFHLTLSLERAERVAKRRGYAGKTDHDDFGYVLIGRPPLFWINAPKHRTVRELADTVAHEVLHAALGEMGHPASFRASLRALLAGRDP